MVLPSALIQDGPRTPTQTKSSTEAPNAEEPKANPISGEAERESTTTESIPLGPGDKAAAAATEEVEIEYEEREAGEKAAELARQPAAESREADDENGDWYIERTSGAGSIRQRYTFASWNGKEHREDLEQRSVHQED